MFKQILVVAAGSFLAFGPRCVQAQQEERLDYAPRTVLPFAIRAIRDPKIASAQDVDAGKVEIGDAELVLGVVVNDVARAYPINQLTGPHREIINDELAGVAIAATW